MFGLFACLDEGGTATSPSHFSRTIERRTWQMNVALIVPSSCHFREASLSSRVGEA